MKQLLLIRHGKSSWDHPGLSDHDRPLNDRGRRDAPRMAAALKQKGVKPDLILSSTAARAATTAQAIASGLDFHESDIEYDSDIYLASTSTLLRVIQSLDESLNTVLMFGHNPGMHETVDRLARDGSVDHFPTLAVGRLELTVDYWGEVEWGSGLLLECLIPRELDFD